jgi:hypothetical protein
MAGLVHQLAALIPRATVVGNVSQKLFTSVWPKLAKTLTTPDSIFNFVHCIITRADIPHEWREEGILMFHSTVAMSGEPEFVVLVDAAAVEPANDNYASVL